MDVKIFRSIFQMSRCAVSTFFAIEYKAANHYHYKTITLTNALLTDAFWV